MIQHFFLCNFSYIKSKNSIPPICSNIMTNTYSMQLIVEGLKNRTVTTLFINFSIAMVLSSVEGLLQESRDIGFFHFSPSIQFRRNAPFQLIEAELLDHWHISLQLILDAEEMV